VTRGGSRPAQVVLAALAAAACAVVAPPVSKLPDGSYRVACTEPLSSCLEAFETVCAWHGYDVISATERRRHADLREAGNETIASEAQVRCKPGEVLFGGSPAAPAPPPAAPAPAAPAPPQVTPLPGAATAEPPASAAFPASCEAPAVDGGAPSCGGTSAGPSGAANPR
jgi:hypothetical protein